MAGLKGILTNPLLSVVMPVYNEQDTIEEMIRRVMAVPLRIQLVVVDDASADGTRAILSRLQPELGFKLVLQPQNQGSASSPAMAVAAAARRSASVGLNRPWSCRL